MTAIYKRELRSYFTSMTGYVYAASVTLFVGIYFMIMNLKMGYPYFASALSGAVTILIFAVPVLTMRSMAEERHAKTDQLLITAPVSVTAIVTGKFFAMLTVYAVPMLISCLCPIVIGMLGTGSFIIDYSAIFMFMFLGALFIAAGMFISSLTDSQVIAAVCTMGLLLIFMLWDTIISYIPKTPAASAAGFSLISILAALAVYKACRGKIAAIVIAAAGTVTSICLAIFAGEWFSEALFWFLSALSVYEPIANFTNYFVFDIGGIIYYAVTACVFVFLTIQSVQRRRLV